MANKTQNKSEQRKPKFLLGSLFVDAPVRQEPEEPQKVLVAGLAEARNVKEYPDTFFGRAFKVFRGEFATLFKATLFFVLFTLPFAVILMWFAGYFQGLVLDKVFNFMTGGIGVGLNPGDGMSNEAVARGQLLWNVQEPVACMVAFTLIIGALGLSGVMYAAKRSYFQDFYKKSFRTYWIGFAKYWWKFLLLGGIGVLIGLAATTSVFNLLSRQAFGTAAAGDYCAVVFSFVIGAPLLLVPMVMLALSVSYELSLKDCFKDALVVIANNPISVCIVGILSLAPMLLLIVQAQFLTIIVYIAMALVGYTLMSLQWVALAHRGMTKCKYKAEILEKDRQQAARLEAKKAAKADRSQKADNKKPKQAPKPYQNPKKKKKKK